MSFDVLITKYSGVVHTIQTFDSVVSQYETSLLQSSRGAIHAIFETFVSKNEIVLSSNFAYAHRLPFAAEMKLDPGIILMIFVHILLISQTIASVAQFQKDNKTITEKARTTHIGINNAHEKRDSFSPKVIIFALETRVVVTILFQ